MQTHNFLSGWCIYYTVYYTSPRACWQTLAVPDPKFCIIDLLFSLFYNHWCTQWDYFVLFGSGFLWPSDKRTHDSSFGRALTSHSVGLPWSFSLVLWMQFLHWQPSKFLLLLDKNPNYISQSFYIIILANNKQQQ